MLKKIFLLCTLFLGMAYTSHSQKFEWIKQIGGNGGGVYPIIKLMQDGRSIIAWSYSDSTKIDDIKINSQKNTFPFVIAFLNKQGKAKWIWKPDSCYSSIDITAINYSQTSGKIYACGNFTKKATINYKTYKGNNNGFIMRLDTNGLFEEIYTLSCDTPNVRFESMIINNNDEIFLGISYNQYNASINAKLSIQELNFKINKSGCFVLKFNEDLKPQKVSETAFGSTIGKFLLTIPSNNTILISYTFTDTLILAGEKYYNGFKVNSSYITYLDSNLKIKKHILLFVNTESYAYLDCFKSFKDGSILIGGSFTDTLSIIPKRFPKNMSIPLIAFFDSALKFKWAILPEVQKTDNFSARINDLDISGDYILAGGQISGNAIFDNFNLPDSLGSLWFFKTDKLGNILWIKRTGISTHYQYINSISANDNKEVLLAGFFTDTIKLNTQEFITFMNRPQVILMKVHDIEITRGNVKSGPYCAGDTINIPYAKNGNFNTGNQFIAQLSDEEGNFTGKERELGRIASDTDGIIKGLLPLFDVESSPNYRIRILSTNPVVQSYYKYDTLRLLIYSKDTANAGKDTTICLGKTIKLTTTGGSRWHWSPGYLVLDSTAKTTIAMPLVTTKYSIIISDSSGCGKIDTAYKTITVRPPLQIKGLPKDTIVCNDSRPLLKLIPSGGLGMNYSYQWLSAFNQALGNSDTFSIKVSTPGSMKAVLNDGCSLKPDTAIINFSIPLPVISKIEKPSCFESSVTLKITGTGGYKNSLNHVWYKDSKPIDIGKTITLNGITKKQWIIASTLDYCKTTVKDSVQLFPNPKAGLVVLVDSACQFQPVTISNQSHYFAPIRITLSWLTNQKSWKGMDTIVTFTKTGKQTISIQITDSLGCTDNSLISLTVIEKPNADFVIIPQNPTIDNGTIELTPIQTTYKKYVWIVGTDLKLIHKYWQTVRLPIFDTSTFMASLMVSNSFGCTDTITKTIRIGVSDAFYIPNAVSNNDDGLNDEFAPFGWKVQSYEMMVVARTDQVVYKGSTPWKPDYEDGVYSYIMKVKFKDGTENTFKGHVHVIH